MAITDIQKVDYLWKKLGYGRAKTDQGGDAYKPATSESIPSPLMLRADKVMTFASSIPTSLPASSAGVVTVYPSATPLELPNPKVGSGTSARGYDDSGSTNRTWTTGLTDWIPPEFGSTYAVKVYIHTLGAVSTAVASGTELTAAGSGNSDEWFFDYQAGVLHFIGTNLPNGISFTGKSIYITGARYTGTFGVGSSIGDFTFTGNVISTSETNGNIQINPDGTGIVQVVGTNGLVIPTGNTAQRPGSASTGTIRFNTSTDGTEIWNGVDWVGLVNEASVAVIDSLVGDNSTVIFNLSQTTTTSGTLVSMNGVIQTPTDAYSVTGNTITFVSAPTSDDNIQVRYLQNIMSVVLDTLTVTGNVSANYFTGNGSLLTGINASYGNANVTTLLASFGSNTITTTGNVSAGNISATGIAGTLSTASQTAITSVGTLTSLAVTGNVSSGNISATGIAGTLSTASQTAITSVGTLTSLAVTGNVSTGNVSGTAGTFTNVYGTIGTAAQASITSLGTLTSLAVTGNITGNYILGNGSQLTGLPATYGNANVVANLAALGSNPISTTGNVTAGNIIGNISITGNVTGTSANVTLVAGAYSTVFDNTGNTVFANGTVSVTTLTASGNISATGSILATPAWTSAGAITLTATTTSPTKGTTTSDNISYRQLGAKQWEIILTYIQTVANGVNGSGDYLVTLPNSLSFDTTLPSQQITTTNIGTNTYALMSYIIPSGSGLINNDSLGGQVYPIVYDATKFRILTTSYSSAIQCWGSGYYALGGDDPKIQLTFRFTST